MRNKYDEPGQSTGASDDSTLRCEDVSTELNPEKDRLPTTKLELRRKAEVMAFANAPQSPKEPPQVHELRVHQIELEMQNEELRQAQVELDILRARYFDLYDLAPVGYCTVSEKGLILESNLTAATLLGASRGTLVKQPISQFIFREDQDIYYLYRKQLFDTGIPQKLELRFLKIDGTVFWANLESVIAKDADGSPVCRVVISDITGRKQEQEVLDFLAQTSSGPNDVPFFNSLARYLAHGLQMDFVCIGRLDGNGLVARSVSIWSDGHFKDNMMFALEDTPYRSMMGKTVCCFPAGVCNAFPRDKMLQDMRAESYIGIILWGHTGLPIGVISVIGRHPLANRPLAEYMLKLVAMRAAGELERKQAEEALLNSQVAALNLIEDAYEARRKAEQANMALKEREEVLKLLINHTPAAIAMFDADMRYLAHSSRWLSDYRIREQDLIGRSYYDIFPDTDGRWKDVHRRCLLGACEKNDEDSFVTQEGHKEWLRWEIHPWWTGAGRVGGIIIFSEFITERKKSLENMQKLNRTLKALSRSDKTMMHATDESQYLSEVCNIVIEDCGYPMVWIGFAEIDENKTVRPVASAGFEDGYLETLNITWADTERGRGPTGTAIRTGKISKCTNMLTDPNFDLWREEAVKRGYSSSIVFPLNSAMDNGKVFGSMTIYSYEPDSFSDEEVDLLSELAEDLSYGIMELRFRKLANDVLRRDKETLEKIVRERSEKLIDVEAELQRAKRLSDIGTLAATVAHELRNPLAAMSMALAIIKRKPDVEMVNKQSENIEKMINESNQIINNLLFYSRLRSPLYENCDLYAILEECIEVQKQQTRKKILFKTFFDPAWGMAMVDPLQMREVFNNLLNNAADAVPASGGQIEIQAFSRGDNAEIIISDNGHGIDSQSLTKVFDPFFTTKAKGTGLGLTVCYQIINMHDGKIEFKSELDKGTAVTIVLPKKGGSHE